MQKNEENMAKIRQFAPSKGAENNKSAFEEKMKIHQRNRSVKTLLGTIGIILIISILCFLWSNSSYSSYTEISSFSRVSGNESRCLNHNGRVITYSKDGISSMDTKGKVIWNETYQMQQPMVEVNGNAVAVGDYNGNIIYVLNEKGKVTEINTNLPIQDLCISKTGIVAAVLKDSKLTRLNLYDIKGNEVVKSECRMDQSGYPVAVALSDNGEVMQVSYLTINDGVVKSKVAFYNFSGVGQNSIDRLVSANEYAETVVPYVGFIGKDGAFAVGTNRISFYGGEDKPVSIAENILSEEIQAVYTGEECVGLVYVDTTGAAYYRLDLYDKKGKRVTSLSIDIQYQNILIQKNSIVVYSNTECVMYNLSGREKYRGTFGKSVSLLIPANKRNRFIMVSSDSIDIIELN